MSQQDGFTGGFLAGALFGGLVGGILGAVIASQKDALSEEETELNNNSIEANQTASNSRQMRASANESIEMESTRRSLEDKIAQLNATIDDVRKQLGNVNGSSQPAINDRSPSANS